MTVIAEQLTAAREDARQAAQHAGVRVVALHDPDQVRRIPEVIEAVWGPAVTPTPDILRALAHAGAVLLAAHPAGGAQNGRAGQAQPAARDAAERHETADPQEAVGCALGFLGWEGGIHLHSHQVGVRPGSRRSGVGYALKLAQRAACLEHGITEMRWTFDPMLARNAGFNFGKLGAFGVTFLPNFYGAMSDAINAGDASDRFEVSWRLDSPIAPRLDVSAGRELIATDEDGMPRRTDVTPTSGVRVPIPSDYAAMRGSGNPAAGAWRKAAREAFEACFDAGLVAAAFGPHGYRFDEWADVSTVGAPSQ